MVRDSSNKNENEKMKKKKMKIFPFKMKIDKMLFPHFLIHTHRNTVTDMRSPHWFLLPFRPIFIKKKKRR